MNDNENCGSATIKIVVHHYAMSQFLIAAEEQDIGTCINGLSLFFQGGPEISGNRERVFDSLRSGSRVSGETFYPASGSE
ncbi:MAG: hypothetical protein GY801_20615 [bacterium]|nr:hypothetical protein [bacterium]